jgi:hypothetical protein
MALSASSIKCSIVVSRLGIKDTTQQKLAKRPSTPRLPVCGRARKGKRPQASAPFGKWGTQTFIAGLRHDRLTAPWVIPDAMDRNAFNTYIETQLAPTLAPGDVVILDNLSVHKSAAAEAALVVGWRASRTAHANFVLDALEQARHDRRPGAPHVSTKRSNFAA